MGAAQPIGGSRVAQANVRAGRRVPSAASLPRPPPPGTMAAMTESPRDPHPADAPAADPPLDAVTAEIEEYVAARGWAGGHVLFALVPTAALAADPEASEALGLPLETPDPAALTPIEQEDLPSPALDEALAQIAWPDAVAGAAVSQEIVLLPPEAEAALPDGPEAVQIALEHPARREARLVVSVRRDGSSAGILRLRGTGDEPDDLLYGGNLAANLVAALRATFD